MAAIKVVSRAEDGQWLLARDLDDVSLGELYEAAHLRVPVAEARLPHHDDALGVAVMGGDQRPAHAAARPAQAARVLRL
jgi:membrane protein